MMHAPDEVRLLARASSQPPAAREHGEEVASERELRRVRNSFAFSPIKKGRSCRLPPGAVLASAPLGRPRAARAVVPARGVTASAGGDEARWLGPAFLSAGAVLATVGGIISLVLAGSRQQGAGRRQAQPVSRDDYLRFRARALGVLPHGLAPPPR